MSEPFCHYWNFKDMEDGATFAHLVEGEAEEQGYIPLYLHPDPRVTELEAVLRECREALVKNIVGTGGRTPAAHEAIAKIDEVLK